jgi:aspartate carbamoyltransferase catalytic subunit
LTMFNVKLNYVSPEILRMSAEVIEELKEKKVAQAEYTSLEKVLPETDVLYVTRVQKERFEDPAVYESVKDAFIIDTTVMQAAKKDMIVMHPLPRVGEIAIEFDDDPRAAYFRQMEYGLYVRMALLAMVLGKA